jgi:hypothetical protein
MKNAPDASDPAPIMRREIKLLRIEVEHQRGKDDEARKITEFLIVYVEQVEHLRANRASLALAMTSSSCSTPRRPTGATIPNSARCAQIELVVAVCWRTRRWRVR